MKEFWLNELRTVCREIVANQRDSEMMDQVIDCLYRIMAFSDLARKEGLLALEDGAAGLDLMDQTQQIFSQMIRLVVDGMDLEMLQTIGANRYISSNFHSYQGLMSLMYIQGSFMIQYGCIPDYLFETLASMLPEPIFGTLMQRENQRKEGVYKERVKKAEERIHELCCEEQVHEEQKMDGQVLEEQKQDNTVLGEQKPNENEIDENEIVGKECSIIYETANAIVQLSDRDLRRLLQETENTQLAMALKGLPGKARMRIFSNLSQSLGMLIVEYMDSYGPAPEKEIEESCVKIMKHLIHLNHRLEIDEYDFTRLEHVVSLFEADEKDAKNNF